MTRCLIPAMLVLGLAACGGDTPSDPPSEVAAPAEAPVPEADTGAAAVTAIEMHVLDCGTIEIADLDAFSTEGDYAGLTDTFTNTCWLIRHPDGDLLWDLGLPGILAGQLPQENGIFTVSLEKSLTAQLRERGLSPADIELMAISHSHFDHTGQVDQLQGATWIVHEDELKAMFPPVEEGEDAPADAATQFGGFEPLEREVFRGEYDVFGDGSVVIFETPGHTPGHTSLEVNLPKTGPVLLSGDMYHRTESRQLQRVPRFNADVAGADDPGAQTLASMAKFEARAEALGAMVIIQHEIDHIEPLPDVMR